MGVAPYTTQTFPPLAVIGGSSGTIPAVTQLTFTGGVLTGTAADATMDVSGGGGIVTSVIAQGGPFLANGTITSSGTIANSSTSLTAHGLLIAEGTSAVVATATLAAGNLIIGQGTTLDPAVRAMSGDATINSGGTLALGSVVAGGAVGSASIIPVLTFDTKGRITNAGTAPVAGIQSNTALVTGSTASTNLVTVNFSNTPGVITALTGTAVTQSITGLLTTDQVHIALVSAPPSGYLPPNARVSSTDTLEMFFNTAVALGITLGALNFRLTVIR